MRVVGEQKRKTISLLFFEFAFCNLKVSVAFCFEILTHSVAGGCVEVLQLTWCFRGGGGDSVNQVRNFNVQCEAGRAKPLLSRSHGQAAVHVHVSALQKLQ